MTSLRNLLLAGAALSLFAIPATAAQKPPGAFLLAQAEGEVVNEAVMAAELAVEAARADLRSAMASGDGIAEARQRLRDAILVLEETRAAAGLPPSDDTEEGLDETAPPADDLTPPAAEEIQPPAEEPPPVVEEPPPPPLEEAPPVVEEPPPPPAEEPPPVVEEPPPPPAEEPPPVVEEPPPPPAEEPPRVVEEPPPPPAMEEVAPPPPVEPPAEIAPPVDTAPVEPGQPPADAPPVVELPPVIDLLPPPTATEAAPPPPPPPPAATEGEFSLQRFEERPDFGAAAPEAASAPALPQAAEQVREGAALAAPDGRVIVKNQGQVTVIHDDSRRFRQRGDDIRSERTNNDTETTTIRRPDGTEIVTVRDRWGNIVQRYVKAPDGSVRILIGQVEQPGFVGRMFGRGPQLAPPPPRQPPAAVNLQFGPLTVTIPQEQYIVETSRADQQQLEQTLLAPPVETVERAYSLEEIRRNGRLRDKVRRIDFDTITFNTGQATVPQDQIVELQSIGYALRDVIQQDPTQVFLIEGHTDAVGSDLSNLGLSDRRAETVAEVLSYYFGIPPENLVTQGYGEQFLKIPTVAAERENRRVAFRNITYLLRADAQ